MYGVVSPCKYISASARICDIAPGGELVPPSGKLSSHGMERPVRAPRAQPRERRAGHDPRRAAAGRAGDDGRLPERRDIPDRGPVGDRGARARRRPRRRAAVRAERGPPERARVSRRASLRAQGRRPGRGRADGHQRRDGVHRPALPHAAGPG